MKHNTVDLQRYRETGNRLPRVRLTRDLEPELVLAYQEEGLLYRKGWEGSVLQDGGERNHVDHVAVLFDQFIYPVWIAREFLEAV